VLSGDNQAVTCKHFGRLFDANHPVCQSCERQNAAICKGQLDKKMSKYHSKKVIDGNDTFDSKKEFCRWNQLRIMEKAGDISELHRQVMFELQPAVILDGRKKPALRYCCDFAYVENGKQVIEDVKSAATKKLPAYRQKRHLMKSVLNLDIKET